MTEQKVDGSAPATPVPASESLQKEEKTKIDAPAESTATEDEQSGISNSVTPIEEPEENGIKVLFLSSDTGGGHRASAQSLAGQFELLFPGSTYALVDLATEAYLPPYNSIVSYYKHLSANPRQWKLLYGVTNSRFMEKAVDTNIKVMTVMCERGIRKKIKSYEPDVVVSVHPLQTSVPILSCAKISHETGKHLPMFTVVTDLGSAHSTWFANGVEKMFVGSRQIYDLAKARGKVPDEKLVLLGLPIRHDFAVEAEKLGNRYSTEGRKYQRQIRAKLNLPSTERKTLLVMGGGEGVGSLANIVDAMYCELHKQGIDAVICVVCGRNETLKKSLEERNWDSVVKNHGTHRPKTKVTRRRFFPKVPAVFADLSGCGDSAIAPVGCIETGTFKSLRRILSSGTILNSESSPVFIPTSSKALEDEKKEDQSGVAMADELEDEELVNEDQTDQNEEANTGEQKKQVTNGSKADTNNAGSSKKQKEAKKDVSFSKMTKSASFGSIDMHEKTGSVAANESLEVVPVENGKEAISTTDTDIVRDSGKIDVVGLGFITNMAEYMVAADVLVSKAGPGTISEAAALSLPVLLTSYLPGQEEGNVDYVVDGGFGSFCEDSDPQAVGEELSQWLTDDQKLKTMSEAAKAKGAPHAARDIVQMIGESTLKWREHNVNVHVADLEEKPLSPKKLSHDTPSPAKSL